MIGPSLGGSAFAWSEGNGLGFPMDYHMCWYIVAITGLCAAFASKRLPASAEKQFEEGNADTDTAQAKEPHESDRDNERMQLTGSSETVTLRQAPLRSVQDVGSHVDSSTHNGPVCINPLSPEYTGTSQRQLNTLPAQYV